MPSENNIQYKRHLIPNFNKPFFMALLKFPFRKTYYEINDYFPYLLCLQKTTFPNKNTPKTRGKFVFLSHNLYIMVMESLK